MMLFSTAWDNCIVVIKPIMTTVMQQPKTCERDDKDNT